MNKAERALLKMKYGGHCAYCGELLSDKWHADHLKSVKRKLVYIPGKGVAASNEFERPENDCIENRMPACPPCNIDKASMPLEDWRAKLQRAAEVLARNNPTYRHAKRFGLIVETGARIQFYFERTA